MTIARACRPPTLESFRRSAGRWETACPADDETTATAGFQHSARAARIVRQRPPLPVTVSGSHSEHPCSSACVL